jgi:hypothetical protein
VDTEFAAKRFELASRHLKIEAGGHFARAAAAQHYDFATQSAGAAHRFIRVSQNRTQVNIWAGHAMVWRQKGAERFRFERRLRNDAT